MTKATDFDIERAKELRSPHVNAIIQELLERRSYRRVFVDYTGLDARIDAAFQGPERSAILRLLKRMTFLRGRQAQLPPDERRPFDDREANAIEWAVGKIGAVKGPAAEGETA